MPACCGPPIRWNVPATPPPKLWDGRGPARAGRTGPPTSSPTSPPWAGRSAPRPWPAVRAGVRTAAATSPMSTRSNVSATSSSSPTSGTVDPTLLPPIDLALVGVPGGVDRALVAPTGEHDDGVARPVTVITPIRRRGAPGFPARPSCASGRHATQGPEPIGHVLLAHGGQRCPGAEPLSWWSTGKFPRVGGTNPLFARLLRPNSFRAVLSLSVAPLQRHSPSTSTNADPSSHPCRSAREFKLRGDRTAPS